MVAFRRIYKTDVLVIGAGAAGVRAAIEALPDGVYSGQDYLDDDGIARNPVKLAVEITIKGDSVEFDFSGSDSQTAGPLNCTYFTTCSAVYYAIKALVGPEIPPNASD